MTQWHDSYESILVLDARDHFAFKEHSPEKVNMWLEYLKANRPPLPGAITEDGMLVDGHHRIRACRILSRPMTCVVVTPCPESNSWAISGRVAVVY